MYDDELEIYMEIYIFYFQLEELEDISQSI